MNRTAKWLWLILCICLHGCASSDSGSPVKAISRLRRVPASLTHPADATVSGIVTYVEPAGEICYLQDRSGGVKVRLLPAQQLPVAGMRLSVSGIVERSGAAPAITNARILTAEPAVLPSPQPSTNWSFARLPEYRRVTLNGVVVSLAPDTAGTKFLIVRSGSVHVSVIVPNLAALDDPIDAEATITGVINSHSDVNGKVTAYFLKVAVPDDFRIVVPAPRLTSLPVQPIGNLLSQSVKSLPAHRVRVVGKLTRKSGESVLQNDGLDLGTDAEGTGPADLAGFLSVSKGRIVLVGALPVQGAEEEWTSSVVNARQVHQLSLKQAASHRPVSLTGVVTYCELKDLCFVEDETDGVYLTPEPNALRVQPGDLVNVTGVTAPGDFAPVIIRASFQKVGTRPMPQNVLVSDESSFLGANDSRWITMEGVVQSATANSLRISLGEHRFDVFFPAPDEHLKNLIDSTVSVQGVCGSLFNNRRQVLGMQLFSPGLQYVEVLKPGAHNPFLLPIRSAASLFDFSDRDDLGHLVHLRGVVTLNTGSNEFWIRDSSGGVRIQSLRLESVVRGDLVEVVGFPASAGRSPMIEGAVVRVAGKAVSPEPRSINPVEAGNDRLDGELVQVDSKLLDGVFENGEQNLVLESGTTVFNARVADSRGFDLRKPGTLLRLKGIWSINTDRARKGTETRSSLLIVGSSADVQVVKEAAWWNPERLQVLVFTTVFFIAIAMGWALLLRRQVVNQTATLLHRATQLEEARSTAESALERARVAENLEQRKKRIVELIARDEPMELVLLEMAKAIESHTNGKCSIQIAAPGGERVNATPSFERDWCEALQRLPILNTRTGARHRSVKEFSSDPGWNQFVEATPNAPATVFAAQVNAGSEKVGVICVFFRERRQVTESEASLISSWCGFAAMAYERRSLYDQLSYRAKHDELTGLPNRVLLFERLNTEIASAPMDACSLGVLYIDLDGFKAINDTFGHGAGDLALREVAERMARNIRVGDTVARVGGDEFVILLPNLCNRADAEFIAEKLALSVDQAIDIGEQNVFLGASIGIGLFPLDGTDAGTLLRAADADMYRRKVKGKQRRAQSVQLLGA